MDHKDFTSSLGEKKKLNQVKKNFNFRNKYDSKDIIWITIIFCIFIDQTAAAYDLHCLYKLSLFH